jgi:hypothetical protein
LKKMLSFVWIDLGYRSLIRISLTVLRCS